MLYPYSTFECTQRYTRYIHLCIYAEAVSIRYTSLASTVVHTHPTPTQDTHLVPEPSAPDQCSRRPHALYTSQAIRSTPPRSPEHAQNAVTPSRAADWPRRAKLVPASDKRRKSQGCMCMCMHEKSCKPVSVREVWCQRIPYATTSRTIFWDDATGRESFLPCYRS